MRRRTRSWVWLVAATLGACFISNSEDSNVPWPGPAGGTGGMAGRGGGPITGGAGGVAGSPEVPSYGYAALLQGGPFFNSDNPPPECADLQQEEALVVYLPPHGDSRAMASPALAREQIEAGQAPAGVRPEEFLNYYRIDSAGAPPAPGTFGLSIHGEQGTIQGTYDLQIGVHAPDLVAPRSPMTITFVVDTSGSAEGATLLRERAVVRAVAESLQPGDVVSLVTWDTSDDAILDGHVSTGANDPTVVGAADGLTAHGGTDLYGGLLAGYALAAEHDQASRLNRVLLVGDGGSDLGVAEQALVGSLVVEGDQQGIMLVGVGVGPAERHNDRLMHAITDQGRARYVYVDRETEARQLFVERFGEVMGEATQVAHVGLLLPWYFETAETLGTELAEPPAEPATRPLTPSDTMVFRHVIEACSFEMIGGEHPIGAYVAWEDPADGAIVSSGPFAISFDELQQQDQAPLLKGRAIAAYADGLATGTAIALQDALAVVETARAAVSDPELDEMAQLIQAHPAYLQP